VAWAGAYLHTKWHLNPPSCLATADMDQKLGAVPLLFFLGGGEAGYPSNTMWPGPRPTCMPSFILIHPTVWPQYTIRQDRQTGRDNCPIAKFLYRPRANRFTNGRRKTYTVGYNCPFPLYMTNCLYKQRFSLFGNKKWPILNETALSRFRKICLQHEKGTSVRLTRLVPSQKAWG